MHHPQHDPNHQENPDKPDDLIADRGGRKKEPLGKKGAGKNEGHKENNALNDVVLGGFDVWIGARLQPEGRPRVTHEIAPALLGAGRGSLI